MKYFAKATHLHQLIKKLKPSASFRTDEQEIWIECETEQIAKDVEWVNECVKKALKEQVLIKE